MRTRTAAAPTTTRFLDDLRAVLRLELEYQGLEGALTPRAFVREALDIPPGITPERVGAVGRAIEAHRPPKVLDWKAAADEQLMKRRWGSPHRTADAILGVLGHHPALQAELQVEGVNVFELQAWVASRAAEEHPDWFGPVDEADPARRIGRRAELAQKLPADWAGVARKHDEYERVDLAYGPFDKGRVFVGLAIAPDFSICDYEGEPLEDVGSRMREYFRVRPELVARILER
jgi:hypothetical protein